MLSGPAPSAEISSMPPATEMFFMNSSWATYCCSAGADQKAWKTTLAATVNKPSASPASRTW